MPDEQHHWSKNLNCWLEMFPSNAFQSESADLCSVGTHLLWQTSLLEVLKSKIASQVKQRKNHSTSSKEMAAGLLSGLAFPVSPEGNVSKRRSGWEQLCGAGSSTALLSGGTRRRAGLLAPTAAGHEGASQAVTRRLCSSRSSSVPSAGFCLGHSVQSCTRLLAQLQQKRCVACLFSVLSRWAETFFLPSLGLHSWQLPFRLCPRLGFCWGSPNSTEATGGRALGPAQEVAVQLCTGAAGEAEGRDSAGPPEFTATPEQTSKWGDQGSGLKGAVSPLT